MTNQMTNDEMIVIVKWKLTSGRPKWPSDDQLFNDEPDWWFPSWPGIDQAD